MSLASSLSVESLLGKGRGGRWKGLFAIDSLSERLSMCLCCVAAAVVVVFVVVVVVAVVWRFR